MIIYSRGGKYKGGKMFDVGREFDRLKENSGNTLFKYIYEGKTLIENAEQFFFLYTV